MASGAAEPQISRDSFKNVSFLKQAKLERFFTQKFKI
jgi:hypothetical protein